MRATFKLCIAIIILFILQKIFPFITSKLLLVSSQVQIRPFTLITTIFLHSNFMHLLNNLFALAIFGFLLEKRVGSKHLLLLFFFAGIFANIISVFFYEAVLGASGSIFGLIGCLAVLKPFGIVFVYGMPLPLFLAVAVWAFFDIAGIFTPSNIAHLSHLSGLVIGITYGFALRKRFKKEKPKKSKIVIDEEKIRRWEEKYLRYT